MIASAGHDAKIVVLKHQNCVQAGRASNHITSRPQRAIHSDGNGGLGNSTSLFWTAKKAAEENEDFSVRKSSFSDRILRSIWANILFKSGVIVTGVYSAFSYPILCFSHCADIFKTTKFRNWKQERSQIWQSYIHCKLEINFDCKSILKRTLKNVGQ